MYSVGIRIFRQCFYERRTGMMKRVIAVHGFHVHRVRSYRGVRGMPPERKPDEVQIRGRLCRMAL